jgi:tetratricopeptide (TPR) repeat protein
VDEGLTHERFGQPCLCCPAQLAETCWILEDGAPAEMLYERLAPYAGRQACGDDVRSNGAVDRYLGQLAALLGRYEDADAHFEAAHRLHERLGARPWEAHTKADHARMLLARGAPGDRRRAVDLLRAAAGEYRSLAMHVYAERAQSALRSAANAARLRRDEDGWVFCFDENTVRVRDSKGVRYLAELLRNPAVEFNAGRLVGEVDPERARHAATRALKGAIDRVAAADPALGAHLRATVRIGTVSSYQPDPRTPVVWTD